MRICLIHSLFDPYMVGGAEAVVKELAMDLSRRGHDVSVISSGPRTTKGTVRRTVNGITIYSFYPANLYWIYESKKAPGFLKPFWHLMDIWNPQVYFAVKDILGKEKPDIVNAHNISGLSVSVWSAARSLGLPMVQTLHDYYLLCPRTTLLKKDGRICDTLCPGCSFFAVVRKGFAGYPDAVISPSEFLLKQYLKNGFFRDTARYVVPYGIETRDTADSERTVKGRGVNFLYIGQLERHKGIGVLIDTFSKIVSGDLTLNIAGEGTMLKELKEGYLKDARIAFHGFVSGAAKDRIFLKSDVLIVPSVWYDNSPVVIYEAYSLGIPIIGARIGGIPELIEDGKTGFLFEPGNSTELTSIMKKFIDNPNLAGVLRQNCMKKAEEFSLDRQVVKYLDIYKSVIKDR